MEGLPKDILRLLLLKYLRPYDLFSALGTVPFHEACDSRTLEELKKKYLHPCWQQSEPRKIVRKDFSVCFCGTPVKKKNFEKHQKKCV